MEFWRAIVLTAIGNKDEVFQNLKTGWLGAIRSPTARNGTKILAALFPPLPGYCKEYRNYLRAI
jgi:hypothetical protein